MIEDPAEKARVVAEAGLQKLTDSAETFAARRGTAST